MNADTLLLRQIHPHWVQEGRVSSQAYRPTPKDENKLSVYDGDHISPEASWRHYTAELKLSSVGVMAITRSQCDEQGLPVDPNGIPFPEHVLIDFSGMSKKAVERTAKILTGYARTHGWLYQQESC
jgi:hypothetical protein